MGLVRLISRSAGGNVLLLFCFSFVSFFLSLSLSLSRKKKKKKRRFLFIFISGFPPRCDRPPSFFFWFLIFFFGIIFYSTTKYELGSDCFSLNADKNKTLAHWGRVNESTRFASTAAVTQLCFFFCFVVGFRHRRFHLFGLGFFVAFSFLSSLRIAALIGGRALVRRENPRRDSGPTFDYICPSPGFHSLLFLVFLPFSFRFFFFFFFFFFFLRFCIQRWRPLWRK